MTSESDVRDELIKKHGLVPLDPAQPLAVDVEGSRARERILHLIEDPAAQLEHGFMSMAALRLLQLLRQSGYEGAFVRRVPLSDDPLPNYYLVITLGDSTELTVEVPPPENPKSIQLADVDDYLTRVVIPTLGLGDLTIPPYNPTQEESAIEADNEPPPLESEPRPVEEVLGRMVMVQTEIDTLRQELDGLVVEARQGGASWRTIGAAVHITERLAHQRWSERGRESHRAAQRTYRNRNRDS